MEISSIAGLLRSIFNQCLFQRWTVFNVVVGPGELKNKIKRCLISMCSMYFLRLTKLRALQPRCQH